MDNTKNTPDTPWKRVRVVETTPPTTNRRTEYRRSASCFYSFTPGGQIARHPSNGPAYLHCVFTGENINTRQIGMEPASARLPWRWQSVIKQVQCIQLLCTSYASLQHRTVRFFQNIHSKHGCEPPNLVVTGYHFLPRFIPWIHDKTSDYYTGHRPFREVHPCNDTNDISKLSIHPSPSDRQAYYVYT
jgi:hypothetical protein